MADSVTKKKLLDAAARVFSEKGYYSATIAEIARNTGVSKGAIFHYFPTKSRVLFSLMSTFIETLQTGLEAQLQEVDDPVEKLKKFIRRHLMLCIENSIVAKVYLHEKQYLDPEDFSALQLIEGDYVNVCRKVILEIKSYRLSKPELDSTTSLYALLGMCNWLYTWYDSQSEITPQKLCDDFIDIYVNGLVR